MMVVVAVGDGRGRRLMLIFIGVVKNIAEFYVLKMSKSVILGECIIPGSGHLWTAQNVTLTSQTSSEPPVSYIICSQCFTGMPA